MHQFATFLRLLALPAWAYFLLASASLATAFYAQLPLSSHSSRLAIVAHATQAVGADPLRCPSSLSVVVNSDLYKGWGVYSNNPLRLTGADISFFDAVTNEEATLDPNETVRLNDRLWSTVSTFLLPRKQGGAVFHLLCNYGEHALLNREIPSSLSECHVTRHGRFNDSTEFEFEAGCK
jgi:hypothetical protein